MKNAWLVYASDDGIPVTLYVPSKDIQVLLVVKTKKEALAIVKRYKAEGMGHIPLAVRKINTEGI